MRKHILLILLLGSSLFSKGGGYQVNLIGIRYIGMGHIGTALRQDAGAIFFNPGALALLNQKYSFSGSFSSIKSYTTFAQAQPSAYQSQTNNPLGTPFSFFGSVKITDRLSAGIGVYTPFGSSVEWNKDWQGRFLIQDISLKTVFFQPTVSYKLSDKIGLGVGLVYARGSVDLNQALPVTNTSGQEGSAHLKGNAGAWGFNGGVFIQATEKLSFGINYRSKLLMNVKNGDATFNVPSAITSNFPSPNNFSAKLPLPASLNVGTAYNFSEKFMLSVDVNYVFWSAYDSLVFDFKNNTSSLHDSRNPRKYKDAFIFRLGGQYKICNKLILRAGTYYDMAPSNKNYLNPETPDSDRMGFSGGLSLLPVERLSIDISFLYIEGVKRNGNYEPGNFAGTYKTRAFIPGIGLNFNF